jgi:hypothetical protein
MKPSFTKFAIEPVLTRIVAGIKIPPGALNNAGTKMRPRVEQSNLTWTVDTGTVAALASA